MANREKKSVNGRIDIFVLPLMFDFYFLFKSNNDD